MNLKNIMYMCHLTNMYYVCVGLSVRDSGSIKLVEAPKTM